MAVLATLVPLSKPLAAQDGVPAPPERLSWYGDKDAPNLSGVWVRTGSADRSDAATDSKAGWHPWPPPLKPPFDATWRQRVAAAASGKRTDDPVRGCLPPGMPRFMSGTNGPLLIIQTPGRVTLYRDGDPVRRIWLNGRVQPSPAELEAFSNGNAIGHYDGTDLVTNVIGIRNEPIDGTGVPHSDDLGIVERFHRLDAKTLDVTITLMDPAAYSEPMMTTVRYAALEDSAWEPHEFICTPVTNYHPDVYIQ